MSRQVRYRVMALALGGFLLGAPLLINGTASADQVEGGGRQVVFAGGGMLGLSCRSQPDVESMTVPADSTIRVINSTGHSVELELGGTIKGTISENGSAELVFHRGTTTVVLTPSCALGDQAFPLLVTAALNDDPAAMPDPIPAPTDSTDSAPVRDDANASPATTAGSALPDAVAPAVGQRPATTGVSRPGAVHATTARPGATATTAAATSVQAMPQGGSGSRLKTKILPGTATAAPTFSGMPPGEHKTIVSAVPSLPLSVADEAAPAAVSAPTMEVVAAEPVGAMRPMPESRPVGLLALVAIVCVIGVAVGAIRAFVSERASRTTIA